MRGTVGFVPVGIEGQLHPQPPDGREDHYEAGQYAESQVNLQSARELRDRSGEHQVKEELEPAGTAFIQVVTVGGARCAGLGRARRRLTRALRLLIWRTKYQPDGAHDDGHEHHRHEKDVEPKACPSPFPGCRPRGEALVTRGRPFCLTDSTLGAERQRQIGYTYGDRQPGHADQNRSIRITTEPCPQTRQRGREWRAPGRRPG